MAITANMTTHEGIALTDAYVRVTQAHVDHFKIDYDLDATDNPIQLAYADLKTNSQLSNVKDA